MNGFSFSFAQTSLVALATGALWWPEQKLLCVSDLHLGKSERIARRAGTTLPPYDSQDTLGRLADDLERTQADVVVCLGDSFDDLQAAHTIPKQERLWITSLQAGRKWIWIEGNHDPGPVELGGTHLIDLQIERLIFRHIAQQTARNEISGHYHPKAQLKTRGQRITRPAFLLDQDRLILPAYGRYTGGLSSQSTVLSDLMLKDAVAILTGPKALPIPMPR
ncbi:ligase-associated DNA damage response endonuclease PdeM [Phaeobacter gallaeciensis]|uniref:Ligase-associated DNA damage response endonuclease PdeM n=2 Tax=Roseobacteraceae TaxID=2854170 RepID=A0A366XDL3_9RHOB|nr:MULTISPECIES: ligase-associated DNA damage response endonuclease PdeM [Roseobacteraceae]MBT3142693.1 ligase-associated DNA damage response endonuclease PdeM [Falsiruegeria litorea]MBT8168217.1 ligase-associated DNA damage response endonuclease PdeM [Falsiruegeria litorea]RBW61629.1 ligase-associated DNA damage response endonuclease PdeM [Phaeobacter gallaeciensis]